MTTTITTTATKASKVLACCFCGCGGVTKSRFVPGHDARFHSLAKKVMRGELDAVATLDSLAHDEAREEFLAYSDKIQPKEDERAAKLAAKAAAKAAKEMALAADADELLATLGAVSDDVAAEMAKVG